MIIRRLYQAGPASRTGVLAHGLLTSLALFGLLALSLPFAAQATPTAFTLKLRGVPIAVDPEAARSPTYPDTGNILGAGTDVEAEVKISGSEYGGFPPPVTGFTFLAPVGVKLHPQGFTACSEATLESHEVARCPKKSFVSSIGSVAGVVSFGGTRVHEALTLQGFFAPGGEFAFYAEGRSPTVIEVLGKVSITSGGVESGPKLSANVPLVETVPGAPYGVVETVKITVGAAFMQAGKLISYITLPKKCPRGGFPVHAELKFLLGEPVTVDAKMPCPAK
jgi:hypothetical protein